MFTSGKRTKRGGGRPALSRPNLYLRDAAVMGSQLGTHTIRIAVKDGPTNQRMVEALHEVLSGK